jgi:hypothetical protein
LVSRNRVVREYGDLMAICQDAYSIPNA